MCLIAVDEYEEAEVTVRRADHQIGEVRHLITSEGKAVGNGTTKFLLNETSSDHSSIGGHPVLRVLLTHSVYTFYFITACCM